MRTEVLENPYQIFRDYNDKVCWQERVAEWNRLAWGAEKAKSEGRISDYKFLCMQIGINSFYKGDFNSAANQFEDSGNPLWAKGVIKYGRKLEREGDKYNEAVFQAKRISGYYASRFHG